MFQEITFQTQKKKKKKKKKRKKERKKKKETLKKFLIFWKMKFSCYKLKERKERTDKDPKNKYKICFDKISCLFTAVKNRETFFAYLYSIKV